MEYLDAYETARILYFRGWCSCDKERLIRLYGLDSETAAAVCNYLDEMYGD